MSADVLKRIEHARTALILDHVFYGHLALKMDIRLDAAGVITRTAATDGRSLMFHPAYVETLTDAELVGLMAHEVSHPAAQHHTRRGNREPGLWNEAADYSINSHLLADGFTLPKGGLVNAALAGNSAEQIYAALKKRRDDAQEAARQAAEEIGESPLSPTDGEYQQEQEEAESPDNNVAGDEGDEADGEGAGEAEGGGDAEAQAEDKNGTGSPGEPAAGELADVPGAVLDAPGDPGTAEAEWQVNVDQALKAAAMMGQAPGSGVATLVKAANRPRTDWRAILRQFVQQTAAADYSWRLPNPRYAASGIYLPALRSEVMPPVIGVIDTSGSTRDHQARFVAELANVADEVQAEALIIIEADASVQRVTRFERGEPVELSELQGQGGTDFRPAFAYIEAEQIEAACVIYLTDSDGTYPKVPCEIPTLWALTPNAYRVPPWGEIVQLDEADA